MSPMKTHPGITPVPRRRPGPPQRRHPIRAHTTRAVQLALLGLILGASAQGASLSDRYLSPIRERPVDIYSHISRLIQAATIDYLTARGDVTPAADPRHPEFGEPGYYDSYYGRVDPAGERETLDEWLEANGFLDHPYLVEHAEYINANDLGFGREMYCLDNGRSSCYVKNYLDPAGASTFAATVAMERMNSGDDSFVAFFVFDAAGNRVNQLNLDSEGPKAVPESCYACHGGYSHAGNPHGGQYLPFDIDALRDWPGHPTREDQLEDLRRLNRIIWSDAKYYGPKDALTDLIEGWYGGPPYAGTSYDSRRLPADSWYTDPEALTAPTTATKIRDHNIEAFLYTDVYGTYCRLCHVAQDLDWQDAQAGDFARAAYNHICIPGNNTPRMPHAEVTFNKFINDQTHRLKGSGGISGRFSGRLRSRAAVQGLRGPARLSGPALQARIATSTLAPIGGLQVLPGDTARDMLCDELPLSFPAGDAAAGQAKFQGTCSGCHRVSDAVNIADYNRPDLRCRGAWLRQDLGSIATDMGFLPELSFQEMQDLDAYFGSFAQCQ